MLDVVCCYYQQAHLARHFFAGVRRTRLVRRVIIVNDEPWPQGEKDTVREAADAASTDILFLSHPHLGYGVARSFNQGLAAASGDFVYLTAFDQMWSRDLLVHLANLARPERAVCGPVHEHGTRFSPDRAPEDIVPDAPYGRDALTAIRDGRLYELFSNANALVHLPSHQRLGGFNEAFTAYGLEDIEYGARLIGTFGPRSILWTEYASYQFASPAAYKPADPFQNLPLLTPTLERYGLPYPVGR